MLENFDVKVLERLLNAISSVLEAEAEAVKIRAGIKSEELPKLSNSPEVVEAQTKFLKLEKELADAAAEETKEEPKKEEEPEPEEPVGERGAAPANRFLTLREFAEYADRDMETIRTGVRRGMIPRHQEGFSIVECCGTKNDPYYGFYLGAGLARSKDRKAQSVARKRLLEIANRCSFEFRDGITQGILSCRLTRACANEELHMFKLGETEFINMSEFLQWAEYWGKTFNHKYKSGNTPHFDDFPEFPVHEFDMIWAMTRKFSDRINPSRENRKALREMNIPHITIRGFDYYKANALENL